MADIVKWEYAIVQVPNGAPDKLALALNEAGAQGWELVAVETGAGPMLSQLRCWFKRRRAGS